MINNTSFTSAAVPTTDLYSTISVGEVAYFRVPVEVEDQFKFLMIWLVGDSQAYWKVGDVRFTIF